MSKLKKCGVMAVLLVAGCKTPSGDQSAVKASSGHAAAANGGAASAYTGPEVPASFQGEDARTEWLKYCIGGEDVADKPKPNYANAEVKAAVKKLNLVFDHSFAIHQFSYKAILDKFSTPLEAESFEVKPNTHDYLNYLCGEFRDRPTMIAAKLRWMARMNFVDKKKAGETFDVSADDVWGQVRIEDYAPYLTFSNAIWTARSDELQPIKVGSVTGVDRPVPGLSVCETKMIFAKFVRAKKSFPGLAKYKSAFNTFKSSCGPEDENFFYDFRGDSNLKPNTPESNGMIWLSQTIAGGCVTTVKAREGSFLTDDQCRKYYEAPFKSRWDGARAGLAAELLHRKTFRKAIMAQRDKEVTTVASATAKEGYLFGDLGPWSFRVGDPTSGTADKQKITARSGQAGVIVDGWEPLWSTPDFGLVKLNAGSDQKGQVQTLLQVAVDRHTYWYAVGYDDGGNLPLKGGAWSPFVASSYEMSKSNLFTSPGFTVQSDDATAVAVKHWMYIFKVPKERLYNTDRLLAESETKVDFDHYWFDERAFGTDQLAQEERAWDRLGEPMEDEYESILYLHNIPAGDAGESDSLTPPHL